LSLGWIPRTIEVPFAIAMVFAVICAIGGKISGIYEKTTTFDFGDRYGNPAHLASRRETELLISRIVILLGTIVFGLSSSMALTAAIGLALFFGLMSIIIIFQKLKISKASESRWKTNP
jgi:hypothetical protein